MGGPRARWWRRLGSQTSASWVAVVIGVVGLVLTWLGLEAVVGGDGGSGARAGVTVAGTSATAAARTPTGTSPSTVTSAAAPAAPPDGVGPGATGAEAGSPQCVAGTSGGAVGCDGPAAGLLVAVTPCSGTAVLAAWGLDPTDQALLITTSGTPRGCVVAPSPEARAAGATALDLARLPASAVPARLRACARSRGAVSVSCAAVHTLEWIGDWRPHGLEEDAQVCTRAARTYTNTTLVGADDQLEAVAVQGRIGTTTAFRCAVTVRNGQLDGSVAGIGGGALPTTTR